MSESMITVTMPLEDYQNFQWKVKELNELQMQVERDKKVMKKEAAKKIVDEISQMVMAPQNVDLRLSDVSHKLKVWVENYCA